MRLRLALAAALLLAACQTTPNRSGPSGSIAGLTFGRPAPGTGTLIIRRDPGLLGGGCGHIVRLDGKLVGDLGAGEEVTVYPPPGDYVIEVRRSGMWCDASAGGGATARILAGKRSVFRTGNSGISAFVEQMAE